MLTSLDRSVTNQALVALVAESRAYIMRIDQTKRELTASPDETLSEVLRELDSAREAIARLNDKGTAELKRRR